MLSLARYFEQHIGLRIVSRTSWQGSQTGCSLSRRMVSQYPHMAQHRYRSMVPHKVEDLSSQSDMVCKFEGIDRSTLFR